MSVLKYPLLFEPIRVGNALFRNRLFTSPTGYQDLTAEGHLTPEAMAYYERKAIGGAAAVTVGECVVDGKYGRQTGNPSRHIGLDDPTAVNSLARLADAVRRHGAVASVELQHAGMYSNKAVSAKDFPVYGPVEAEIINEMWGGTEVRRVIPMDEEMIAYTIDKFADAAVLAKRCGYGMVTVHGGHGWLLSQFVSPVLNTRTDRWGGSIENRCRLLVAIADAIHKKCGAGFPVEMRISGSECWSGGYDIDYGIEIAKQLDGHVDIIHVSAGSHEVGEVFTVTHPSMFLEDGVNVKYAAEIKKHIKQSKVATVGALADPALMEEILASGRADIVEVARGIIAEPDLPNKAREGRDGEIKKCMRCLSCFSKLLAEGQFYCAINPKVGRDLEYKHELPPVQKKKVVVIGGGVAGMQAALTAAEQGHAVTLFEAKDRLGGTLRCEEKVPFKAKLEEYLDFQERAVKASAIDLRLGTTATPEAVEALGADVIISALGARAVKPNIPGIEGKNVVAAEEVFLNPELAGEKVVILGAGLVGVELGIYLSMLGRKVEIVEMLPGISDGGNALHTIALNVEINKYGIGLHFNTRAKKIDEKGVTGEGPDGEARYEADTVIYAVGQAARAEEASAFHDRAPQFWQVGDCLTPKNIMESTATAYTVARDIGRY
ncbi:MAG: NAD(P)/FAD-dependent oxidoreductase [Oscillospiraceae bacterium]|jgi:2,4-dienoyl-CoA reductase-like NADH-dependent reductase (Old Yellow Enzyme family)/thioredoxin reductase|nr:NAD(P)/FAD-dependent oxidoreductase [Oscillospiraceae bacterium]